MEVSKLGSSAPQYAALGWSVLPLHCVDPKGRCSCKKPSCSKPGKHPLPSRVPHGVQDATTDSVAIRSWWQSGRWLQPNIGIATGSVSGLVVLDVDPDADGFASLDQLTNEHGALPDTLICLTGSGGLHFYFKHPGGVIRNTVGRLGSGLDIRADGGYVVAPPSLHHSGQQYTWAILEGHGLDGIAEVPSWLVEKGGEYPTLTELEPNQATALVQPPLRLLNSLLYSAADYWLHRALHEVRLGNRNHWGFWLAELVSNSVEILREEVYPPRA